MLPLENIECVIFDLDGTLYNKRYLPLRMVLADWRHIGLLRAERAARKQLAGKYFGSVEALYKMLFSVMSQITCKPVDEVRTWYYGTYMPTMVRVLKQYYSAMTWACETLTLLKNKRIRTVVFSDYGCVREKLDAIGLSAEGFAFVCSAPEMGGLKPCKEAFENLLHTLQVKPANALMIGDRDDTDGAGARSVGMKFYKVENS